jgi:NAD(P) transhydrogenase subunit alpha
MMQRLVFGVKMALILCAALSIVAAYQAPSKTTIPVASANLSHVDQPTGAHPTPQVDFWSMLFVFVLATFIGIGVIARVSRLLHTPLMSITNAISAIAVVGSIIVTGADYPTEIRILGAIALFASMTNIVSGFLITDRMLKMFKSSRGEEKE